MTGVKTGQRRTIVGFVVLRDKLYEVLECGHRRITRLNEHGYPNKPARRCPMCPTKRSPVTYDDAHLRAWGFDAPSPSKAVSYAQVVQYYRQGGEEPPENVVEFLANQAKIMACKTPCVGQEIKESEHDERTRRKQRARRKHNVGTKRG